MRGIGGSERHLLALLPALAARGLEAGFVGLDDPRGDPEPFYAQLRAAGIPFLRLACPRDLDPLLALRLARALRSLRPHLVHTHLVHADVYGAAAPGTPVVSTKHNPDPFRAGPFRMVERLLARRAARLIAISRAVARFYEEQVGVPAAKLAVVHYGLDALPPAWRQEPAPFPGEGARLLLCVSRLEPQKGVDTAVQALALVRRREPAAVLAVLGEGPERPRLERLARHLGLDGAVILPGRVGDVAAWYRRAEMLVHPARWEGFGLAMLEAMLCGIPVVASSVGGIPDVIKSGENGLLVRAGNAIEISEAVRILYRNQELRSIMGKKARETIQTKYNVKDWITKIEEEYLRVVSG